MRWKFRVVIQKEKRFSGVCWKVWWKKGFVKLLFETLAAKKPRIKKAAASRKWKLPLLLNFDMENPERWRATISYPNHPDQNKKTKKWKQTSRMPKAHAGKRRDPINHFSHWPTKKIPALGFVFGFSGGPCRIRTRDQPVMSRQLLPTALRVHGGGSETRTHDLPGMNRML